MNRQLNELHLLRGRLLERIATQRLVLSHAVLPVSDALRTIDRVVARVNSVGDYVKSHPSLAIVAMAALFFLKSRRVLQWAKRGFFAWQAWRAMRERLSIFGARVRS